MRQVFVFLVFSLISFGAPAVAQPPFKLSAELHEGARYDENNLPPQNIAGWYRIPIWFAGRSTRNEIHVSPGVTVKNVRTRTRGKQLDAQGHIWEAQVPVHYDIDRGETVEHIVLTKEEPVNMSDEEVSMHYVGLRIMERKDNGKIIETQQNDENHIFRPQADGTVRGETKNGKVYDADGMKLFNIPGGTYYIERHTGKFQVIDQDDKCDYRSSFLKFLKTEGLSQLIPKIRAAEAD